MNLDRMKAGFRLEGPSLGHEECRSLIGADLGDWWRVQRLRERLSRRSGGGWPTVGRLRPNVARRLDITTECSQASYDPNMRKFHESKDPCLVSKDSPNKPYKNYSRPLCVFRRYCRILQ
jgi:hypothetical protein